MPLGPEEIYLFARHAGFSPDQAVTMTAIALAESGGNTGAHNPHGEDSRGLWQVNLDAHPKFQGLDASDPLTNARMAFEVSGGGADIGRWTVTHGDKGAQYLRHREQAEAASRAFGENGQGQWNPPANYQAPKVGAGPGGGPEPPAPLPTVSADGSDAEFTPAFGPGGSDQGQPAPTSDVGLDSDEDGLLDRYETSIGTDADAVDSDRDGFSDRDEILEFGTDPTDFGSNPLGATGGVAPAGPVSTQPPPSGNDLSDVGVAPGQTDLAAPDLSDVGVAPGQSPVQPFVPAANAASIVPAAAGPTVVGPAGNGNVLDHFLDVAVAQSGKPYVFGTEASAGDLDPDAFDCSELIEWAGGQVGVTIPDGSFNQYLFTKNAGAELTVEEALQTPGALLFKFSSTPVAGGGRPSVAHVAISLGNGQTIEARSSSTGTAVMAASDIDWTHGGYVPDLGTALSGDFGVGVVTEPVQPIEMGVDSDEDGLLDTYERLIGTDPFNADTDRDGFVDSIELHDHRTDPLDFTDNVLTPGSTGGYRPPLTTDLAPAGGQPPGQTGDAGDVVFTPGTGSRPPVGGSGSPDPAGPPSGSESPDAGPTPSEPEAHDPTSDGDEDAGGDVPEPEPDTPEPSGEPEMEELPDIEIGGDDADALLTQFDDDLDGLADVAPDIAADPLLDTDDGDFDGDA